MSSTSHSSSTNPMQTARGVADTLREKGGEVRDTIQQMDPARKTWLKPAGNRPATPPANTST